MSDAYQDALVPDVRGAQRWAVLTPIFLLFCRLKGGGYLSARHDNPGTRDPEVLAEVREFQKRLNERLGDIEQIETERRVIRAMITDPEREERLKKAYCDIVENLVCLCSCNQEADSFLDFLANASLQNKFPDYFLDAVIEVQDNLREIYPEINQIDREEWARVFRDLELGR